jgi:polyhydroxyalkanoate synthesis repressor PhaR
MSDQRVIKKYPNRRLYDTVVSSYITLADVKRLVLERVNFRVVEARSGEDITRTILLQIISEEEGGEKPIFSSELLAQVIRFYGGTMQNLVTSYLEKSLNLFLEQQRVLREQTRNLVETNPVALLTQIAERNLAMWKTMATGFCPPSRTTSEESSEEKADKAEKGPSSTGVEKASPPDGRKPDRYLAKG